jgi:putative pyruvate formate lyase activating enzyme
MLHLQDVRKCHNINLVSPGHFVPQIVEAVSHAVPLGLRLPLVYNSNGYDDLDTLRILDGIIDIYMPDIKYHDTSKAAKYSCVHDYPDIAQQAIKEMYRQVGLLQTNSQAIALKGLIIRHLVLPHQLSDSRDILRWISSELSNKVTLSLMAQYYPAHHAAQIPLLSRPVSENEYAHVLELLYDLDFPNALYQEINSSSHYRPRFFQGDHPFE